MNWLRARYLLLERKGLFPAGVIVHGRYRFRWTAKLCNEHGSAKMR